jgi:hypothetical protein
MTVGSSNRIVVELPTGLKPKLYAALKQKGMTLREWFVKSANQVIATSKPTSHSRGRATIPKAGGKR